MSGYSETVDCPRCGSVESLERSVNYDGVTGICLECGYEYHTVRSVLSLDEINNERACYSMEPLTELKPPLRTWYGDND